MKIKITLILLICLIQLSFITSWSYGETPTERIRGILEEVTAVQGGPELQSPYSRDQQTIAISKIIARNFNFDVMSRNALHAYWGTLNNAEREEFKDLFQELFQDSYSKLVLQSLKREKISYTQEKLYQKNHALVKTVILRGNEKIPVDYSMMLMNGRWLVKDVIIDGVSIVLNYERQFTRIIKRESFRSLMNKMRLQKKAIRKSFNGEALPISNTGRKVYS